MWIKYINGDNLFKLRVVPISHYPLLNVDNVDKYYSSTLLKLYDYLLNPELYLNVVDIILHIYHIQYI